MEMGINQMSCCGCLNCNLITCYTISCTDGEKNTFVLNTFKETKFYSEELILKHHGSILSLPAGSLSPSLPRKDALQLRLRMVHSGTAGMHLLTACFALSIDSVTWEGSMGLKRECNVPGIKGCQ